MGLERGYVFVPLVLCACVGDTTVTTDGGADTGVDACAVGSEGCPCTSGGACNSGLTCLSKLCVQLNTDAGPDSGPADGSAGDADAACSQQPPFADPLAAASCTAPACLVSSGGTDFVKCEPNGTTCTSTDNGVILNCSAGPACNMTTEVCCLKATVSASCPTLAAISGVTIATACQTSSCPSGQIQLCNATTQCKNGLSCVYGGLVLNGATGVYLGLCQ